MSTAGPPLDLNLGPSELSEHRWTSTWDPPSSVSTAGPQPPDRMPEDMPDRKPDGMPEKMLEDMPDRMPEGMPDKVPECLPDRTPEHMPGRIPEDMPDRMPEDMSDRIPEDLPVTKCIMVGITRSKVFFVLTILYYIFFVFKLFVHWVLYSVLLSGTIMHYISSLRLTEARTWT